jgi:hypothetical protein
VGPGFKPVCDHPSYCKNDDTSIYIGQDSHMAYWSYLSNDGYWPSGWNAIKSWFQYPGFCAYSSSGATSTQHCFENGGSHSGQHATSRYNKVMCADYGDASMSATGAASMERGCSSCAAGSSTDGATGMVNCTACVAGQWAAEESATCTACANGKFVGLGYHGADSNIEAELGARNGVLAAHYTFVLATVVRHGGAFDAVMRDTCGALGNNFKPVCDHPSYCKNDDNSIYIGQDHHLAYGPHLDTNSYFPSGFPAIKSWLRNPGFCAYTARDNGDYALCFKNGGSHSWQLASSTYDKILCAQRGHLNHAASDCRNCEKGAYLPGTGQVCSVCPEGKYSGAGAQTQCDTCPDGTTSSAGSEVCYDPV